MRIRLAVPGDLPGMAELDRDPGGWGEGEMREHVRSLGTLKVAAEGRWLLGWVSYRKADDLLVIERLAVRDDPQSECGVAERLVGHVERLGWKCRGIDLALTDGRPVLSKTLASMGYRPALIRDYYGSQSDAVAFHKVIG